MIIELHQAILEAKEFMSLNAVAVILGRTRSSTQAWAKEPIRQPESYVRSVNDASSLARLRSATAKLRAESDAAYLEPPKDNVKITATPTQTTYEGTVGGKIMKVDEVWEKFGLNKDEWEVVKLTCKPYAPVLKINDMPHQHETYSIHLVLKPRKGVVDKIKSLENLLARIEELDPKVGPAPIETRSSEYTATLPIPDVHLGKMAMDENLNIGDTIAEHDAAVAQLLDRVRMFAPKELVLLAGNDLTNVDGVGMTTTSGRVKPESNASWYSQMDAAVALMIRTIKLALAVCGKVTVLHVPGNHDFSTSYGVCKAVQAYFFGADEDRVEVKLTRNGRIYHQMGKIGIGAYHGDCVKDAKKGAVLFALEAPQIWANSVCREVYTGHLHGKQAVQTKSRHSEDMGVVTRRFSSLGSADAWHEAFGFKGNAQNCEILVYSETQLVAQFFSDNVNK